MTASETNLCPHQLYEMDMACVSDGLCPLCLQQQIKALTERNALLEKEKAEFLATIGKHITVRSDYFKQLSDLRIHAEAMCVALERSLAFIQENYSVDTPGRVEACREIRQAITSYHQFRSPRGGGKE